MPVQPPSFIKTPEMASVPIEYKWTEALSDKFYTSKDANPRLYDAIDEMNFKAKMALGVAIAEWILWRFEGHADLQDAHRAVEASWASVIHPAYAKPLPFELDDEPVH